MFAKLNCLKSFQKLDDLSHSCDTSEAFTASTTLQDKYGQSYVGLESGSNLDSFPWDECNGILL